MRHVGLDEAQAGIKRLPGEISVTSDMQRVPPLWQKVKNLSLLMKVKEESEKVGLKLSIQKAKIMASGPITSWQIEGKPWKQWKTLVFWAPRSLQTSAFLLPGRKVVPNLDSLLKSRDITLPTRVHLIKAMVFLVFMYRWESWTIKKAEHLRIDFELWFGRTLESPLDCKKIQPVHPKGNQSWIFIGRTDAKAETPILWPPDAKTWLIGKDLDAARDWRREEKGTTEDEMVGWHHRLNGIHF